MSLPQPPSPAIRDQAVKEFNQALRRLKDTVAPDTTIRELASRTNYSHTAIHSAFRDGRLPSRELLIAVVKALGEPPEPWLERWQLAARQARAIRATAEALTIPRTSPPRLMSLTPPTGLLPTTVRGQTKLLDILAEALLDMDEQRMQVLHGLGGVGKTTAALTLARDAASPHGVSTWWIQASSPELVHQGMLSLAVYLGVPTEVVVDERAGPGWVADLVWSQLNQLTRPWLLIFDGADVPDILGADGYPVSAATGWLRPPDSTSGTVLVTSRVGNVAAWGPRCRLHHVSPLAAHDGAAVLDDLTAGQGGSYEDAVRLSERLGGLPLALAAAGNYLAHRVTPEWPGVVRTFAEYLDTLNNPALEDQPTVLVKSVVDVSLRLLDQRGLPYGEPMLKLLAILDSDPLPLAVLDPGTLQTHAPFDTLTENSLSDLLHALQGIALIDVTLASDQSRLIQLHPMVRAAILHNLDPTERHYYLGIARVLTQPSTNSPAHTPRSGVPRLSEQEKRVLRAWFDSGSKKIVARKLFVSESTVARCIERVRNKYAELGRPAPTKVELVQRALEDGLIKLTELGEH